MGEKKENIQQKLLDPGMVMEGVLDLATVSGLRRVEVGDMSQKCCKKMEHKISRREGKLVLNQG